MIYKRKINIYEIAEALNVAPSTVSKAFSNKHYINEKTRKKIIEYAKKNNYYPNQSAKSLSIGRTDNIGLLLPGKMSDIFKNEFYLAIADGIERALLENNLNLLLYNYSPETDEPYFLFDKKTDGLLIIGHIANKIWIKNLKFSHVPVVLVDNKISSKYDSINTDNKKGIELLFKHLLSFNIKNIGLIHGPLDEFSIRERYDAFLDCLKKHRLLFNQRYILEIEKYGGDARKEIAVILQNLINNNELPDAFIFVNDATAIVAIDYLKSIGIKIPQDIKICGFDNIFKSSDKLYDLTTVNVLKEKMGYDAVNLLVERIKNVNAKHRNIILDVQLIIRSSTVL